MKKTVARKSSSRAKAPDKSGLPHGAELPRLKRVQGQLEGIEKMILDQRYCVDIILQVKAARSALHALENSILKSHLKGCVREAIGSRDAFAAEDKIQEIADLVGRL